jgi:two-component system response regulator FixJ
VSSPLYPANDRPTILLVEDDEPLRSALRFALEIDGYEVWSFATGEAVLDMARLPEDGLLVLDEKLPGMGGLDLLETLRARGADMPVVLITTPNTQLRARAKALGAPIIEKPLVNDDFLAKVHSLSGLVSRATASPEQD